MAKEINPKSVFDRLFAGRGSAELWLTSDRQKRELYRKSILDFALKTPNNFAGGWDERPPEARRVPDIDARNRAADLPGRHVRGRSARGPGSPRRRSPRTIATMST